MKDKSYYVAYLVALPGGAGSGSSNIRVNDAPLTMGIMREIERLLRVGCIEMGKLQADDGAVISIVSMIPLPGDEIEDSDEAEKREPDTPDA